MVGAVVVGDEDLVWRAGLVEERVEGLGEEVRLIECGNSYGEAQAVGAVRHVPPSLSKSCKVFKVDTLSPDFCVRTG